MDQARYFLAATWYRSVTYTVTRKLERGAVDSTLRVSRCKFWKMRLQLLAMYGRKSHAYACVRRHSLLYWSIIFSLCLRTVVICIPTPGNTLYQEKNVTILRLIYVKNAWENYSLYLTFFYAARSIPLNLTKSYTQNAIFIFTTY